MATPARRFSLLSGDIVGAGAEVTVEDTTEAAGVAITAVVTVDGAITDMPGRTTEDMEAIMAVTTHRTTAGTGMGDTATVAAAAISPIVKSD